MKSIHFRRAYGPWAVVLGASKGIGRSYAMELSRRGLNIVLVARGEEGLREVAGEISKGSSAQTRILSLDLSEGGAVDRLDSGCSDLDIGLVVFNAALAPLGRFTDEDPSRIDLAVRLNCTAIIAGTRRFGERLQRRGSGGIIIMSSLAGLQGSPYMASYAATKAFLLVLGESLWYELGEAGVDVLTVAPGAVATPGFFGGEDTAAKLGPFIMKPQKVVAKALKRLRRGGLLVPGFWNKLGKFALAHLLPRKWAVRVLARVGRGFL